MILSPKIEFVICGDSRKSVEDNCGKTAWRSLADNGFVDRLSVSCVGFHRDIASNSLLVVFPKAFSSTISRERLKNPDYLSEQIYRLIRVFRKIRRETSFNVQSEVSKKASSKETYLNDPVLDSFEAALRLRQEFNEYGIYVRKSSRLIDNCYSLPVNWPHTFRSKNVMLNGSEIFLNETVHHVRKSDLSHPLCLLHISCLKEIFSLTGERRDLNQFEALDEKTFKKLKTNPRRYLRNLKTSIFDERGRSLISSIAAYLGESSLIVSSIKIREELLSFSKDFEDIWEQVLRDLISPSLKNRTLPIGRWYAWPSSLHGKGIQPEFDIRLTAENSEILIDAKDYRIFNGTKWFGSSSDHYKQTIYRKLIVAPEGVSVINILAFPNLGQRKLFAIRGCHHWEEIPESKIFEITVDFDLAMKGWLKETSINIRQELVDLISELKKFTFASK